MPLAVSKITRDRLRDPAPAPDDRTLWNDLQQRAALLELILADLLGPRSAVQQTNLPPRFVVGLTGLCRRAIDADSARLRAYSAELIACPDGIWRVAADRTARAGNHPAAILLEAPALACFLPALCRCLLSEPLRLSSVPCLWLGDPEALSTVVAGAGRWALVDAFRRDGAVTLLPDLAPAQRIALQARVDAAPWRFAARLRIDGDRAAAALVRGDLDAWLRCR